MKKSTSTLRKALLILLILVLLGLGGFLLYDYYQQEQFPEPPPEPSVVEPTLPKVDPEEPHSPPEDLHKHKYSVGGLGPDQERREYYDQSMILKVPRLDYEGPVLEGMLPAFKEGEDPDTAMDEGVLYNGIALFNQSLLPGVENRNVTIAGHRDIYGQEFFYIDTIQEGDLLYLYYNGKEYIYAYEDTVITDAYDWDYVKTSDYSTLTLQSCDPVYVATERIFVYGYLIDVRELSSEEIRELQKEYPHFSASETYVESQTSGDETLDAPDAAVPELP